MISLFLKKIIRMISLFLFNHFYIIKFMLATLYTYQNKNEKSFSNIQS